MGHVWDLNSDLASSLDLADGGGDRGKFPSLVPLIHLTEVGSSDICLM